MQRSGVVDTVKGGSTIMDIRTSSGTFLARGEDDVIRGALRGMLHVVPVRAYMRVFVFCPWGGRGVWPRELDAPGKLYPAHPTRPLARSRLPATHYHTHTRATRPQGLRGASRSSRCCRWATGSSCRCCATRRRSATAATTTGALCRPVPPAALDMPGPSSTMHGGASSAQPLASPCCCGNQPAPLHYGGAG